MSDLRTTDITDMVIGVQDATEPDEEELNLKIANMEDEIRRATEVLAGTHQHHFTYLLNQNHTALRGCACGLTFVGLMAGPNPGDLCWHRVKEEEEL